MTRRSEMEAKIRKGPVMLGYAKFHDRLKGHVLELADDVDRLATNYAALESERDEYKRRCDTIAAWINANNDDGLHLWLLAIAEGRDNG